MIRTSTRLVHGTRNRIQVSVQPYFQNVVPRTEAPIVAPNMQQQYRSSAISRREYAYYR